MSSTGEVYIIWVCGTSTDNVTGCKVEFVTENQTVAYTAEGSRSSRWWWRGTPSLLGIANGTYTVRVYGYNNDGNGDAATATVSIYDAPVVNIISPTSTVDALPFAVTWSASDDTGISEQQLWVYFEDLSNLVLYRVLDGDARTSVIGIEDVAFENDSEYIVIVGAFNGVGLYASDTRSFTTHWVAPPLPTVTVITDTGAMAATITPTAGAGTPATDHFIIMRVNPDGTRWVIADDVEPGESVTDPLPPLGVECTYSITAVTDTGTTSVTTVTHTVESSSWTLNFGANASEVITGRFNPKTSWSIEQGGAAYHFADGGMGNGLPVWYSTTDRDISGSVSWDVVGKEQVNRINALSLRYPVGWLRDPFGNRWRAHIVPKFSRNHNLGRVWQVSIDWDAVRFEEAW